MKNLAVILLLGVMLTQALGKFLLVMDYQANKDFITELFCINKSKPQLQCQGHCYLKKNLKKAEESEKQAASQAGKADITLFCQALFQISRPVFFKQVSYAGFQPAFYRFTSLNRPFHPPQITG
ncbi:MAG: hypothetical protein ACO1NZ_04865 [Adhaeribacter sp.]